MRLARTLAIAAALFASGTASAQQAGPYFRLRLQASGFTPPTGYLNVYAKSSNKHLYSKDSLGNEVDLTGGGSGTVTSVGMTVPSFLSVAGSPVTTSGTLAVTLGTQVANRVFAGPSTGADAAPTFRALVAADLPNTAVSAGTCTSCDLTIDAQGRITAKASGAGGSTGNYTFSSNTMSNTAAGTLSTSVATNGSRSGWIINDASATSGDKILTLQAGGVNVLHLGYGGGSNIRATAEGSGVINITDSSGNAEVHIASALTWVCGGGACYDFTATHVAPETDGLDSIGKPSGRFSYGFVGSSGADGTCDAANRGAYRTFFASGGASDKFRVCMKSAADSYSWVDVGTAP